MKELRRLVHKAGEAEFTDDEKETFHAALSTIIRCWSHVGVFDGGGYRVGGEDFAPRLNLAYH